MIHEFAVDPEALASWQNFRFVVDHCGVSHGRLISAFPKKWKRMVYEACASCSPMEKTDIEVKLRNIDPKLFYAGRAYDGTLPWIVNALASTAPDPFRAIITTSENASRNGALSVAQLSEEDPEWAVAREWRLPRKAVDMAAAAERLLQISEEVVFVDQYFSCGEDHGKPLSEFLKAAQSGSRPKRIEYHLGGKKSGTGDYFAGELNKQRRFLGLEPGISMVFVRWMTRDGGENLHPRYILTERGGLRYDYGLDQGGDGETTDVGCLDSTVYQERWKQYQCGSGTFELVDAWIVTATAVTKAVWDGNQFVPKSPATR